MGKLQNFFDVKDEEVGDDWREHWEDMPEFVQNKKEPYAKIIFRFETEEDLNKFSELIGQKLNSQTKSAWFPEKERGVETRGFFWETE
jgi:hypothetical protein